MSALGRRYAKALLELAREQGEIEPVLRDVAALAAAWKAKHTGAGRNWAGVRTREKG